MAEQFVDHSEQFDDRSDEQLTDAEVDDLVDAFKELVKSVGPITPEQAQLFASVGDFDELLGADPVVDQPTDSATVDEMIAADQEDAIGDLMASVGNIEPEDPDEEALARYEIEKADEWENALDHREDDDD